MADDFSAISALIACPCDQHGKLRQEGAHWVSECCGHVFKIEDGVLVLLRSE